MIVRTASSITLALSQDAEILALYAVIGGFSTPALLSTAENHEIVLFSYVCVLDLAILVTSFFKPWRRLMWVSFIGTVIMFAGWADRFYSTDQRSVTLLFAAFFAAIVESIALFTPLE